MRLLVGREVDRIFRYPRGRAVRLAKSGRLPHIRLPDGEIRFDAHAIERLLKQPDPELQPLEPEVSQS